jgi:hypothetical protein
MIRKVMIITSIVTLYLICVFLAILTESAAAQQQSKVLHKTDLYLPLASLVYGPNLTQIINLNYRYAEAYHDHANQKLIIWNPGSFIPSVNITHLPKEKDLQVVFGTTLSGV